MTADGLPWISLEGVNGVGKTYYAREIAALLGPACLPVAELPDSAAGTLPAAIIAALRGRGDPFLRTGFPLTETLLLSALQVHRWESLAAPAGARLVLEDRGPYSVAVYQAVVIAAATGADRGDAVTTALRILDLITSWRPRPAATVLLRDDPAACLRRFEQRIRRAATGSECRVMAQADHLYQELAAAAPDGLHVIDLTAVPDRDAAATIADLCLRTADAAPAGKEPACTGLP